VIIVTQLYPTITVRFVVKHVRVLITQ
jgi:hypothetical protein